MGYGWIGPRPVFVVDLSGSMAGLKLASLIDNFVQLLRPGGQMQRQCEAFGILAAMGGAVKCFPTTISRPLGACLLPTSAAALEEATDWVCSWRAGGCSCIEAALEIALSVGEASEVVVLADQCPTRGVPMSRAVKLSRLKYPCCTPINTVAFECDRVGRRVLKQVQSI